METLFSKVSEWKPVTLQEKVVITNVYNNLKQQHLEKPPKHFQNIYFRRTLLVGSFLKKFMFFFVDSIVYLDGCSSMYL